MPIPFSLLEFDANNKTKAWFAKVLLEYSTRKRFLVTKETYRRLEGYAEGAYDTSKFKSQYDLVNQTEEQLGVNFSPIAVFNHIEDELVDVISDEEVDITATCTDPTATSAEDRDINLLKAKKQFQPEFDKMAGALGLPPNSIGLPKKVKRKGQEVNTFSSNVDIVDKLKLNPDDEQDMDIFKDVFQRQHIEVATETVTEHYFKVSDIKELRKKLVKDLARCNKAAAQVILNKFNHQPNISYLRPDEVFFINGQRQDRSDADGVGFEKLMTVRSLLRLVADEITDDDLVEILTLANQVSNTNFDCIQGYEKGFPLAHRNAEGIRDRQCNWNDFLQLRILVGYIEFKSQNAEAYKTIYKWGQNLTSKMTPDTMRLTKQSGADDKDLERRFFDVTYKGYYLPGNTQLVYCFGKVPMQRRWGSQNQLSDYTIKIYDEPGQSLVERCIPFIDEICKLWFKYQFFTRRAKPMGRGWNIDALGDTAKDVAELTGKPMTVVSFIKVLEENIDFLYKPQTVEGQQTGGTSVPFTDVKNGVDATAKDFLSFIQINLGMMRNFLGSNAEVEGQSPKANEPEKADLAAIQSSFNATGFIADDTRKMLSSLAVNTGWYVQQIIDSDDEEGVKAVRKAVGDETVDTLKTLRGNSPANFSIFLEDTMTAPRREEIHALTMKLIDDGIIDAGTGFQINGIRNYKLAQTVLAYNERKGRQQAQDAEKQKSQNILQIEQGKSQLRMAEKKQAIEGDIAVQNLISQRLFKLKEMDIQGKEGIQDKKLGGAVIQNEQKHDHAVKQIVASSAADNLNQPASESGNPSQPNQPSEQAPAPQEQPVEANQPTT